ncbi:900_t:CDS:1 [Scutellospora calospora]|uniref:900_t:CDS:1 n=1 Tax=Scutellospora calospora TaxID=85575 RepID=A0ACA9KVH2_9GLOM|nr:900_t:CDS:1 [Scutellospora calospora]
MSPRKPRIYATRACTNCQKRHEKCSGAITCTNCIKRKLCCEFINSGKKRGPKSKENVVDTIQEQAYVSASYANSIQDNAMTYMPGTEYLEFNNYIAESSLSTESLIYFYIMMPSPYFLYCP